MKWTYLACKEHLLCDRTWRTTTFHFVPKWSFLQRFLLWKQNKWGFFWIVEIRIFFLYSLVLLSVIQKKSSVNWCSNLMQFQETFWKIWVWDSRLVNWHLLIAYLKIILDWFENLESSSHSDGIFFLRRIWIIYLIYLHEISITLLCTVTCVAPKKLVWCCWIIG